MAQPAAGPNLNAIALAFTKHYYTLFDTDRSKLVGLYQNSSKMTFEGEGFQGPQSIMGKLTSLKFKSIQHIPKTVDVQPSGCNGLIVFVCGDVKLDSENPIKFSQVFHLMPTDPKMQNFWVHNDVFRLNYG